jgi:hypothetical protein
VNNVRHEASRHFRNRRWEYLKINDLETNSKNNIITDLDTGRNEFKKGYLYVTNGIDAFHSSFNTWKNHCLLLLNLHGVNYVRQSEMCTAGPLVPEPLRLRWL